MSALLVLAIALCLIFAAGVWRVRQRSALRTAEHAWRPDALRNATIAYAEQKFFTKQPFPLVAKIDRAYRTADRLVLTELKRRSKCRFFPSDVVELSAQKLAIERSTSEQVGAQAYVVVEDPQTLARTPIAVTLLGEQAIVGLARRHAQVMKGSAVAQKANVLALCRACTYADRCRPEVLRGGRTEKLR